MDELAQPVDITVKRDESVTVTFSDGLVASFDLASLRTNCPCAQCRGRRSQGLEAWTPDAQVAPLAIVDAGLHGAWGLTFEWNDGHGAGIFPFEALRRWAEGGQPYPPDSGLAGVD